MCITWFDWMLMNEVLASTLSALFCKKCNVGSKGTQRHYKLTDAFLKCLFKCFSGRNIFAVRVS